MTARILIADDSLTIQKVIGITLASSGYDLMECLSESDLFKHLEKQEFNLVLLDFNLSETKSGYDLAKLIKAKWPHTAIMIMLGTFDTVDDAQFSECGINDKIIKPFESGKFIKKCQLLLDNSSSSNTGHENIIHEASPEIKEAKAMEAKVDLWTVDTPHIKKDITPEVSDTVELEVKSHMPLALDPLSSELAGWGLDLNINLEEKYNKAFPAVIEEVHIVNALERLQESSDFVVLEELAEEIEEEIIKAETKETAVLEDTTEPLFEIPTDFNQKLILEVNEEISPESFWAVDEVVTIELDDSKDIKATHLDEMISPVNPEVKMYEPITHYSNENREEVEIVLEDEPAESTAQVLHSIDQEEMMEKLKASLLISLKPMMEEMIRDYCRQSAEKIAWEIIPDLAENLIKKELKEISESIQ